ncbi:alpha-L-rhamnosidase [uncultured Draconibacterium sp.]|uniref:alpha-L-rhamnosidase n=1 Tax=uncultured Draconibacterium sp. TaxID=1573823 RepID=UPI0025FDD2A7|nr:alpha-L-rhamnosidase [uncultured Draconibacterium sp.]
MFKISELVTEYHKNPLGIETCNPRLSWKLKSDKHNVIQTAYHIKCALSEKNLNSGVDLLWDSGKVVAEESIHVLYQGEALKSGQRIFWQVRAWNNKNEQSDWSETSFWEMGLLNQSDWQAKWIEPDLNEDTKKSNPCPLLRKSFHLEKEIEKARIYVSAHGLYQLQLNGKKVGDEEFTPGWTTYHKRLQYQVFDVTKQICNGENAIGAILGDGWYRGYFGWQGEKNHYGEKTALLLQLQLTFTDGTQQTLVSDKSWKAATGAILESEIYHGEVYDARKEKPGWDRLGFNDSDWQNVVEKSYGFERITNSVGSKVKVTHTLEAVKKIITPKGETVLDFGQNMVGRIRFSLKAKAGEKISIYHAEVLDKEGNFYTTNLRPAKQRITYIFKGNETETYSPHFTFMGFRYIKIEDYPGDVKPNDFTGEVIHSDMEFTGNFECSDPLINQLQSNIQWGLRGNFLDIPTDCPQRDERMGWTGDAQVFAPTACFNTNAAPFFAKWLKDLEAEQRADGSVPWVVPNLVKDGGGTGWSDGFGATGWADAAIIIPWVVYQAYGDTAILKSQYSSMKAWEEYMIREAGDSFLFNTGFHFGDWLSFAEYSSYIYNAPDYGFAGAHTEKDLIATAYFYYSTSLMAKIADITGEETDAAKYKSLLTKIKEAFKNEFITPNGRLLSNTQAAYAIALTFNVIPDEYRKTMAGLLAKNVEYFQHLTTGFLGTPVLCDALSDIGRTDLAYKLLFNKKYPSWLYAVTMGATTIWERWDGIKPDGSFQNEGMNSFNHYAYGAIGNWLYTRAAGIQSHPDFPGYKKTIIKPELTDKLDFAKATLQTVYGQIKSEWKLENGHLQLTVTLPPNTTATVFVPGKGNTYSEHEMGSGTMVFESKIE